MLLNFLFFYPLILGAYFVAATSVLLSFGLLVATLEFLEFSGMSQGTTAFNILYLFSALLLLFGLYKVNLILSIVRSGIDYFF